MIRGSSRANWWSDSAAGVYRRLLIVFPETFRARYGAELVRTGRDASEAAFARGGWIGMVAAWLRLFSELLTRGPRERLPSRRSGVGGVMRSPRKNGDYVLNLMRDVRYALRGLMKNPVFAAVAVLTLALGIGANSAIFSVVNGVVLRPLPYQESHRLAALWMEFRGGSASREIPASEPEYLEYRAESLAFEEIVGYWTGRVNVGGIDAPERVVAAGVSTNLLTALGVSPMLGRGFAEGEDLPGADPVVILGHGLWQRAFGSDEAVVGRSILVNGRASTVIGVMPASFIFPGSDVDLLRMNTIDPLNPAGRASHYISMMGRLRPDVSIESARTEIATLMARWNAEFPGRHGPSENHPIVTVQMRERLVGTVRPALLILAGSVALVLLIACANVANLMLARAESRQRELGVRVALGASRGRLVGQVLTESTMIGLLGGVAGIVLAALAVRVLSVFGPADLPRIQEVRIDGAVLTFTAIVSVVTGWLFGALPALGASRSDTSVVIRDASRASTAGAERLSFRRVLVVSEIALAVMLVIGAGLLIKSFTRLQHVDPGFDSDGVVALDFALNSAGYPDASDVARFHADLAARLDVLPGVVAAGAIRNLPLRSVPGTETLTLVGRVDEEGDESWNAEFQVAAPGYFPALRVPLMTGRLFTSDDRTDAPPVVIINESMARALWPDGDMLGKQIQVGHFPDNPNPLMTIVGVVGDVRQAGLDRPARAQIFVPRQQAGVIYGGFATRGATLAVRADIVPAATMRAVRNAMAELDPNLPLANVQTLDRVVARSISDQKFVSMVMGIFSAVALALGAVGIYGLMAYSVAQRTQEIGLRMALGADSGSVLKLVVGQGMTLTAIGVAVGVVAALAASRVVAGLVFEIGVHDPVVFAGAPAVLLLVSLIAAYIPARRAATVDPMIAIRSE